MQFDWSAIWPAIPLLIEGAKMTLWISVLGLAGGLVIGLLAGFARTFGGWIANHVALVFIEVIRGTPIVVQVMFIYFALPMAFNDLRIDPFTAAVVTIMINSGAYIAEITRGAVLSIHKGFREAGLALGLSRWETIRYVILPLALRRMLPPLGNQWIISIKDTSLFIVIGVAELTRQGQEIIAGNFRALEIWSAVAVFYLIITLVLSFILRRLERRMKILFACFLLKNGMPQKNAHPVTRNSHWQLLQPGWQPCSRHHFRYSPLLRLSAGIFRRLCR